MRGQAMRAAAVAVALALCGAALAGAPGDEEDAAPDGPAVGAPVEDGRYALRVLHQPERDLDTSDPHINVMIDTRTGRTWVLRYHKMPQSHERGYVWVEVPFHPKPQAAPAN